MNTLIVSTYPKEGSQNMGDLLISDATQRYIKQKFPDSKLTIMWREMRNDMEFYNQFDLIVFACLAIRPRVLNIYPDLEKITKSTASKWCLAAGTRIDLNEFERAERFSSDDIKIIRDVINESTIAWSRGKLTENVFAKMGLHVPYLGDIIMHSFNSGQQERLISNDLTSIYISDPHYLNQFSQSFRELISNLRKNPTHKLTVIQHGKNTGLDELCQELNLPIIKAFESDRKWNVYQDCDVHIGYRIHGYMPALSLGKRSMLLAQDGRGLDYWHSIPGDSIRLAQIRPTEINYRMFLGALRRGWKPGLETFNQQSPKEVAATLALEMHEVDHTHAYSHIQQLKQAQLELLNPL